MNWDDYVKVAGEFACYPEAGTGSYLAGTYVDCGLDEEAGEVRGHVKRLIRDDGVELTPARREALLLELGDLCWYLSRWTVEHGFRVDHLHTVKHSEFTVAGLCEATGDVTYAATCDRWTTLNRVAIVADMLGSTLAEVLDMNIAKLTDRKARGVLKGSGDKR